MPSVSAAAISKARLKISPEAFIQLNDVLVKEFYTDNSVKTPYGFIILAIDGSTIQLPNSKTVIDKYGCVTNQTDRTMPMARISYMYDVANGVVLDALIKPYKYSEEDMAYEHVEKILELLPLQVKEKLLLIFDRGYPSADFIAYLKKNNIQFIIRCPKNFIREVNEAVKAGKRDSIIELTDQRRKPDKDVSAVRKALYKYFPGITTKIKLRILLIKLKNGEVEILLTSLLDKLKHPYNIFLDLYFMRWEVESVYHFHKIKVEIENFSGTSSMVVEQDFHALILSANSRAILDLEAQEEVDKELKPLKQKYDYQINKVVSMIIWKNEFVNMLMEREVNVEAFCTDFKKIMKKNLVPIRPQRMQERKVKHTKRRFFMNHRC